MNVFKATLGHAVSGMDLQSRRLEVTSENISNADTPGYRRKILLDGGVDTFSPQQFRDLVVSLDDTPGERTFDPDHPMADPEGYVLGSNVSVVVEMADMREASRTYEANLNAFQNARTMYRSLLDVLRG
jgi:flagellar basal-body rod protein FlgC